MQMLFKIEKFLEVAIESWSEWDLNPRPLNSVQTLEPTELFYGEKTPDFVISCFLLVLLSTIPDKIFGTKWSNPVKLDRKRKV